MHRLLLCFAIVSVGASSVSGQVALQWKLKKGDVLLLKTENKRDMTVRVMGVNQSTPHFAAMTQKLEILDVKANGQFVIRQTIQTSKIKSNMGNDAQVESAFKGSVFQITYSPQMEILNIGGISDFVDRLAKNDRNSASALRSLFTQEVVGLMIAASFGNMPKSKVKTGATWKRESRASMASIASMKFNKSLLYAGKAKWKEQTLDQIKIGGTIDFAPPKKQSPAFPFRVTKVNMNAKRMDGVMYVDAEKGYVPYYTMTYDMAGSMTITTGGRMVTTELTSTETYQAWITRVAQGPPSRINQPK